MCISIGVRIIATFFIPCRALSASLVPYCRAHDCEEVLADRINGLFISCKRSESFLLSRYIQTANQNTQTLHLTHQKRKLSFILSIVSSFPKPSQAPSLKKPLSRDKASLINGNAARYYSPHALDFVLLENCTSPSHLFPVVLVPFSTSCPSTMHR